MLSKCAQIMHRYPEIFPIVRILETAGNVILEKPDEDLNFYVRHNLETRIGLQFQVAEIVNGANKLWPLIPQDISEKAIIQNVLLRYSQRFPMKHDIDAWKALIKKERLE